MSLREKKADDEHHDEGDERFDQPCAQFDQMVQQRRFAGLDLGVGHRRFV